MGEILNYDWRPAGYILKEELNSKMENVMSLKFVWVGSGHVWVLDPVKHEEEDGYDVYTTSTGKVITVKNTWDVCHTAYGKL